MILLMILTPILAYKGSQKLSDLGIKEKRMYLSLFGYPAVLIVTWTPLITLRTI